MKSAVKGRILVVDDDAAMRSLLEEFLKQEGYQVRSYPLAQQALKLFELKPDQEEKPVFDIVISDMKMPEMDGMEFLRRLRTADSDVPVVLITAFGSVEEALQAIRAGAYDYVVKPFKLGELAVTVGRAMDYRRLKEDNQSLREQVAGTWRLDQMIGKSPAMRAVFDLVQRVAQATANVLITGESGTGKEMVARAIHRGGPRANKPFIAINCTAVPETLLESEFFGHAKGSFTGAVQRKRGLFEEANGGTLFLDEIGDMDLALQSKILRAIQERKIRPVGENQSREIDVRIIAATHKDLKKAVKEGRFREDLYYRLSVIPMAIPALKERKEDIPILAQHFVRKYAAVNGTRITGFTQAAMAKLVSMRWEGNVRELENLVERLVVLSPGPEIADSDLPSHEAASPELFFEGAIGDFPTLDGLERRYIEVVLKKTQGRKQPAAEILGIDRRTLYRKEREYGFVDASAPEPNDDEDAGGEEAMHVVPHAGH